MDGSIMASTGGLFPTHGSLLLGSRGTGGFMQGLRPDEHIGENLGSAALDSGAMLDSFATPHDADAHGAYTARVFEFRVGACVRAHALPACVAS